LTFHKHELRKKYRDLREKLSTEEVLENSIAIANHCLAVDLWTKALYHLFLSSKKKNEVNTSFLLSVLQGKDKQIVVSKILNESKLEHYLLSDQTLLKENDYGIPEPISGIKINPLEIDVVFLPLLVFDKQGHRVGYGKGYYDRFLADCQKETIKVGISFFEPIDKIEDIDENDIAMDFVVTPNQVFSF
jgi:5-formyltetrahydrofolate cyclo-ligase|tara:strand:+ start:208 stop:774 length:567 start_codon:yes stop_codon:yes gene_type:complete